MDYTGGGGGGSEVQQPLHHHMQNHAHPYSTPQSATAPTYQYPQHIHDPSNLHPNHIHHAQPAYYHTDAGAARQSLATPSTPSQNASPQFARMASPASKPQPQPSSLQTQTSFTDHSQPQQSDFVPTDRSLPSLDVSDDTFEESYADFILYCNPSFPLDTDTAELKRVFRTPPKSDGKSFSTFTLFELLKKLESKELKTWTELALELGVEKPSVEKGQSSQKVQQYSVRLKRWMRALHIDAFFEYLMGKKHAYFSAVPPLNDPFPDARDGVPIEEDLAIRAINPKFRPKRGRRRADEQDGDVDALSAVEPKRPHLDTSVSFQQRAGSHGDDYPMSAYPSSAVPMSAHPDFANGADPWTSLNTPASALAPRSAMSTQSAQQLRWRNETPSTPHPLSAVTPMSAHPDGSGGWDAEPQSAITPSSARSVRRRRHGPAVSSAWPSTNTTANGKLRGRPPSNRSVRDGPFVTFPANPKTKEAPLIDLGGPRSATQKAEQQQTNDGQSTETTPTPSVATDSPQTQNAVVDHTFLTPQLPTPISASTTSAPVIARPMSHPGVLSAPSSAASSTSSTAGQRPERLQLQVPQHVGGPVHLVTPTLLVNGLSNDAQSRRGQLPPPPPPPPPTSNQTPGVSTASTHRSNFVFSAGGGSVPTTAATTAGAFTDEAFLTPNKSPRARQPGPGTSVEDLKRALVGSLLAAEVEGRSASRSRSRNGRSGAKNRGNGKRLSGSEARDLADAILQKLDVNGTGHTESAAQEMHRFLCASWLDIYTPSTSTAPFSPAASQSTKKITIRRFRTDRDGFDSPLDDDDPLDEDDEDGEDDVRETLDVEWVQNLGGVEGRFAVRGVVLGSSSAPASAGGDARSGGVNEADTSWKERFLKAEEELANLRARVLDAVV